MLGSAVRGAAGARLAAIAVLAACAFALSACGGDPDETAAADGSQPAALTNGGGVSSGSASQRSAGASQPEASAAVTAAALDTTGWVLPPPFYAAGDEPFWRLDIVDGWFVFKRSGLPEIEAPMVQPTRAGGADLFDTPPLKLRIKREACETDAGGKGDISALVTLDDNEFGGCAFGGSSATASAEATAVIDAVKAIDACLKKLGDPALVTAVYPREGERTAVGLRARDGSLYECAVEPDGGTIAFLDPIEPRAASAWMSRMRFLRAGVSDATKCEGAEEVRSGDKVLGRLLAKTCKF